MSWWRAGGAAAIAAFLAAGPAWAQGAQGGTEESRFSVRTSFKATGVLSDPSRDGMLRGRVEPGVRINSRATFEFAYEQRLRTSSTGDPSGGSPLGVLPSEAPPPYRLTPLDWELASSDRTSWRHEIDRAALQVSASRVNLTVGRQAIGWGRGVLFGAIDLFSPFPPFEVDREWRRGVDALRADARISTRASADVVAAFGESADDSAYAARFRAYAGEIDVEAVAGWRAGDTFGGAATSFVLGQAEIHAEVAVFDTPAVAGSTLFGTSRTITKIVAGGSYRLPIAAGVPLWVEYHYSGFGVTSAQALIPALLDPEYVARVLRGDTQILTRHAIAIVGSYEWSPIVAASGSLVHEPTDGSGVAVPSLTLTFGDRWSLLASGYLTYGADATRAGLQSAYGASPNTFVLQLRYYR